MNHTLNKPSTKPEDPKEINTLPSQIPKESKALEFKLKKASSALIAAQLDELTNQYTKVNLVSASGRNPHKKK